MLAFDLDPGAAGHDRRVRRGRARAARRSSSTSGCRRSRRRRARRACRSTCRSTRRTTYARHEPVRPGLAQLLERRDPEARRLGDEQGRCATGKVFVDWSQNDEHKTTVCVYSLRAKAQPTVSTPLRWEEVEAVTELARPGRPRVHPRRGARARRRARRPVRARGGARAGAASVAGGTNFSLVGRRGWPVSAARFREAG